MEIDNTNQKNTYLLLLVVVLLILIVGVSTYYLWIIKREHTEIRYNSIHPTPFISPTQSTNAEKIMYKKDESWGPCSVEQKCYQNSILYNSGKLVLEGKNNSEKILSKDLMNQIVEEIKKTGVITKSCEAERVLDYDADYKIYLDNLEKSIRYPGCESELHSIERLFLYPKISPIIVK